LPAFLLALGLSLGVLTAVGPALPFLPVLEGAVIKPESTVTGRVRTRIPLVLHQEVRSMSQSVVAPEAAVQPTTPPHSFVAILRQITFLSPVFFAVLLAAVGHFRSSFRDDHSEVQAAVFATSGQPFLRAPIAVLNGDRLNFDGRLGFGPLEELGGVAVYSATDPADVLTRIEGRQVVVTKEMPVTADLLAKFPASVRLICEAGTGYNNIDLQAAKARGIAVCNVPAYSTEAVAHLVITFVLAHSCSLVEQQRALFKGDRRGFTERPSLPHTEVVGKALGLVGGNGAIGSAVAHVAKALGMRVLVYSRSAKPSTIPGVQMVSLEELLVNSDYVSLHCPLTGETRGMIDAAALRLMKPTAFLINTARGAIIKETDLIEALRAKTIAGAALDVQDPEPPLPDSPLWDLENVILTPHIGWTRLESRQRLIAGVAGNIAAFLRGQPTNVLNP
jgi:glycerate dehydrogenase